MPYLSEKEKEYMRMPFHYWSRESELIDEVPMEKAPFLNGTTDLREIEVIPSTKIAYGLKELNELSRELKNKKIKKRIQPRDLRFEMIQLDHFSDGNEVEVKYKKGHWPKLDWLDKDKS